MERDEFARHLRRIERKIEDARDELDELKGKIPAEPPPAPAPVAKKDDEDPWK